MMLLAPFVSALHLFRVVPFRRHDDLPICGRHALNEVLQISHSDVQSLCHHTDLLDRFLWNLSTYCLWDRRRDVLDSSQSDYERTIAIIEVACPALGIAGHEFRKRQASGVGTTTIAATVEATSTASSTTVLTLSSVSSVASSAADIVSTSSAIQSYSQSSTATASNTLSSASLILTTSAAALAASSTSSALSSASSIILSSTTTSNPVPQTDSQSASTNSNLLSDSTSSTDSSTSAKQASTSAKVAIATSPSSTQVTKVSVLSIASSASLDPTENLFGIPTTVAQTSTQFSTISSSSSFSNPTAYLPTQSYIGQAILVGTCTVPTYTAVQLFDGSYLVAPVVGCNDYDPGCCPSLTRNSGAPTPTPNYGTLSNAAIITALAVFPITTCPADYTSTSFVCCPLGFSLYNQAIFGQTPCASVLPRPMSTPTAIAQDIQSLSSFAAATASGTTPSVSVKVIVDQIFALNLPLKQGIEKAYKPGMSTVMKIGIGVGAGLGALFLLLLCAWLIWFLKRRRSEDSLSPAAPDFANDQSATWVGSYNRDSNKTATSATTAVSSIWRPITPPVSSRASEVSTGWRPSHQQNVSQFTTNSVNPNWQLSPQQHQEQHPYIRQPPPRFTEGFMGMPTGQTTSPPLPTYSPPYETHFAPSDRYRSSMSELPDRGLEIHEADSGVIIPEPQRNW